VCVCVFVCVRGVCVGGLDSCCCFRTVFFAHSCGLLTGSESSDHAGVDLVDCGIGGCVDIGKN